MASGSNSKNNKFRIALPVIFTFGASLVFFQGNAQASDENANSNVSVPTIQTSNNQQGNNYQAQSYALQAQAVQTQSSIINTDPNKGAVDINPSMVQSVENEPAVNTQPNVTQTQVVTQAGAQNSSTSTVSGVGNINTAGLSASRIAFLSSIHQGAVDGWKQYGVLPSLTASQAIIESGWGQSGLTTRAHNLFGIKGSYNGHSITMLTYEYYGGRYVRINDAFRAYSSNYESIVDHGRFLRNNRRYSNLIGQTNYQIATRLIRQDGYATDPSYTNTLNSVIQRYNLTAWDQEAFNNNINTGHLDNISVNGSNLQITGWHASSKYNTGMHHFIILIDGNTKQELYRQEVAGSYRSDVQRAYPNAKISGWGGFNLSIPYSANYAGRFVQVVSRYTYSTNGEPNGGEDIYYNPVTLNANAGYLDNFTLNASDNTISISGWHAADQSLGKSHHFIIIFDATKGHELGRYEVNSQIRNDVARAYSNIYNSGQSGFNLKLNFSGALTGDQIQVISRYSNANNGEGNYVDYWFAPKTFNANAAHLDHFEITNNKVHISGWQAADASAREQNHFIILYDATKHREIKRFNVSNVSRPDVQRVYPNIYNAGKSGFDITVDLDPAYVGDQIQVISRYSNASNGEGNRTDYRFAPKAFTANEAHLDSFVVRDNQLTVTGWQAADASVKEGNHFIILYDATTHREIARQKVDNIARPDVQRAKNYIYNAGNSGFKATFTLPAWLKNHQVQIISRYSDANNGEGNRTDYWFNAIKLPEKLA